jgi:transcription elongation factor Elf1
MKKESLKTVITGTRTGSVIRFTCHGCRAENAIICRMPKDFYRETRDATCARCKNRSTVLTPGANYYPVR